MNETHYKLILGDILAELPKFHDQFDLIIADPPFGIKFDKSSHEYGADDYKLYEDEFTDETYFDFSKKWIQLTYEALKPEGSLYIISGWTNLRSILNSISETNFYMLNHAIWHFSWGVFTKRKFVTSHYHVLLLTKSKKKWTFSKQIKYDEDVFYFPEYNRGNDPDRIKGHPCQLPLVLLEKLVLTSSNENDLVGDIFSGSGGTILAARRNKRNVIGFEIRDEYEQIIKEKAKFGQDIISHNQKSSLEKFLK